jgi:hypothetical protein
MADKLSILYNKTVTYDQNLLQQIGTDKDYTDLTGETPLRVPETHSESNCLYVRKYGVPYEIKSVSAITDPVDTDMTFGVYALDGTLLGRRVGGGAFTAGTTLTTAQACYLKVTAAADVDVLSSITIDTDINVSGLTFTCATETVLSGKTLNLYLAENGDTYYDSDLKYGGKQTAQDGSLDYPYDNPKTAYEALNGSLTTIVTILDSETYILDGELDMDIDGSVLQSAAGETPTIKRVIGATTGRKASQQYNNLTAIYFNENGSDSNPGTWQEPKKSLTATALMLVYGGSCAGNGTIIGADVTLTGGGIEADHEYYPTIGIPATGETRITVGDDMIVQGLRIAGQTNASPTTGTAAGLIIPGSDNVTIKYCTFFGTAIGQGDTIGIHLQGGAVACDIDISFCEFQDMFYGVYYNCSHEDTIDVMAITYSYFNYCISGIYGDVYNLSAENTGDASDFLIENTVFFNCQTGITFTNGGGVGIIYAAYEININFCLFTYCTLYGQSLASNCKGITADCYFTNITSFACYGTGSLYISKTVQYSIFYSNGVNLHASYFGNNNTTTAIKHTIFDPINEKFGVGYGKTGIPTWSQSQRRFYSSDDDSNGVRWRIIKTSNDNLKIQGIIFDTDYFLSAFYLP